MGIDIESNSQYLMTGSLAAEKTRQSILQGQLQSKPSTDEDLMEVCKSFEAYLLEQVMKGMEKTIPSDEKKNPYLDYFGDILYQEYATSATENQGLGLAQMLYESMKRNGLDT